MDGERYIRKIQIRNLLSFGPDAKEVDLQPLNVLIGPNGSGKSNFLEALWLLRKIPGNPANYFRIRGGPDEWLYRGRGAGPVASVAVTVNHPVGPVALEYRLGLSFNGGRVEIVEETIRNAEATKPGMPPIWFYTFDGTDARLRVRSSPTAPPGTDDSREERRLSEIQQSRFDRQTSILAQLMDYVQFPEISYLRSTFLNSIKLFRNIGVVAHEGAWPQLASESPDEEYLREDLQNLAMVLARLKKSAAASHKIQDVLQRLLEQFEGFTINVDGPFAQLLVQEKGLNHPTTAKRLSGGTLRFFALLAMLMGEGRGTPQILCLEEPELGLHPDALPIVAELLVEASKYVQLIVTTHSQTLVSAFGDVPDAVLVCERGENGTEISRLVPERLKTWLDEYTLGDVWRIGEIGGNRW
jgi:predicted ATPase